MGDTFIHMVSLPSYVRGLTIPDENGDFTIIINDNLDDLVQRKTLEHELQHVILDHFYDSNDVAEDEVSCSNHTINSFRGLHALQK